MRTYAKTLKLLTSLFLLPVMLVACGDSGDVAGPPEGPADPFFNISSIGVTLAGGEPGLQFRASSNTRVRLVEITVTNPNNQGVSYSPQGLIVQANEAFDLQAAGTGFFRWSGTWRFTFVGNHEPGGQAFNVTASVNVGA